MVLRMSDDWKPPVPADVKLHALVIDDDPLSSEVQSQLIRLLGHHASAENDGDVAVERALAGSFDFLLLDLSMPGVDGFEVLRRLRVRERELQRPRLPVIAVTGYVAPEDRARCLAAGFAEHLHKPVQLSRLQAAIEGVVSNAAAVGQNGAAASAARSDAERLRATVRRLGQMSSGEGGFSPSVTEAFALRSAQLIETLHSAIAQRDGPRAIRAAQALGTGAQFLGAATLAASAAAVERCCGDGDWPAAQSKLREFDLQHQAVLTVLFDIDR